MLERECFPGAMPGMKQNRNDGAAWKREIRDTYCGCTDQTEQPVKEAEILNLWNCDIVNL